MIASLPVRLYAGIVGANGVFAGPRRLAARIPGYFMSCCRFYDINRGNRPSLLPKSTTWQLLALRVFALGPVDLEWSLASSFGAGLRARRSGNSLQKYNPTLRLL